MPVTENDALGAHAMGSEAVTLAALVATLTAGNGVGPVNSVLVGLADAVAPEACGNDVATAVTAELARRYLRAVRCRAGGAPVGRSWQVLFDWWDPAVSSPLRATLAGVATLVGNDLAPAVVSTCTLLGHAPGPVERDAADMISGALTAIVRAAVHADGGRDPEAAEAAQGLVLLLARRDPWRMAEHLWTLRGHPAEAEAERSAVDWRASTVGKALLGTPAA